MMFRIERTVDLPIGKLELFDFFGEPRNLNKLTPPWLHFKIIEPIPTEIDRGTTIDYSISLKGMPMRWRTLITRWEPGKRFVDTQIKGPYKLWHHLHLFEELPNGGTRYTDLVRYKVPVSPLVNRFFVRPDLEKIFDFRAQQISALFDAAKGAA